MASPQGAVPSAQGAAPQAAPAAPIAVAQPEGFWECLHEAMENARNGPPDEEMMAAAAAAPFAAVPGAYAAPTAPGAFEAAAAPGAAPAAAAAPGGVAGLGGGAFATGGFVPGVIGDMFSATALPPQPPPLAQRPVVVTAVVRGFKIAENQSPRPIDRIFGDFNFYENINRSYYTRLGAPIQNVRAYRQIYGFEKTFLNGQASFGLRQPINTLVVDVNPRNAPKYPRGTFTDAGFMDVWLKYVVLANKAYNRLLTVGMDVAFPTGPASFAGYPNAVGFRNTYIQPYLGYLWVQNRWFIQGFSSVMVPTDRRDATFIFNDVALGYYLYQSDSPRTDFLTAVVPTYEVHVNTPTDHVGFNPKDIGSQPDVVNFTFGGTFVFKRRAFFTVAYVTPVTGPKPFEGELVAFFNFRYGGLFRGGAPAINAPPSSSF
jgi:hypothetical protein